MIEAPPQSEAETWYRDLLGAVDQMIRQALAGLNEPTTTTLWYMLSGGTTALATTDYIEGPVDFPFVITGYTLLSRDNGAIVLSLRRSTYVDYPVFTVITGTTPPTLVSHKAQDAVLTNWTTQINGGDILAIGVTSNAGAVTTVSLGLRIRKLGSRA